MPQENIRYKRNPEYVFRKIFDETLLVPICQKVADMEDCIYTINAIGAIIWEKIGDGATVEAVEQAMQQEYPEIEPQEIAHDVKEFFQALEATGAVQRY